MEYVPELRFFEFSGDWEEKRFGSVSKYIKGFAFKSKDYRDEGTRIVRVSDLGADYVKNDNDKTYISDSLASNYEKYQLKAGNIIITTVGSKPELKESAVGRGIYVSEENEGLLNQNLLKLENIEGVVNKFLFSYVNTPKYINFISSISRGNANQANITVKELFEYKIYVASLQEQQKIATFLSAVDKKLGHLRRKHELLEHYKRGAAQRLFSIDNGKLKSENEVRSIRFKPDNACAEPSRSSADFPDWEKKQLGDIAKRRIQKNKDSAVKRVLTNSATKGVLDQQDYFDKEIANANNLMGYYVVSKGDYVYNPRISVHAPVGPINKNKIGDGVMSPLYTVFRFDSENDLFYEQYFRTTAWHKYMKNVANYGARHDRMNITTVDFMAMPLPYPCAEEQQKITNFVTTLDRKLETVQKQIDQTEIFKKGLLQKMFV